MRLKAIKQFDFIPILGAISGGYRIYNEITVALNKADQAAVRLKQRPSDGLAKTTWDYLRIKKIVYGALVILPVIGTIAALVKWYFSKKTIPHPDQHLEGYKLCPIKRNAATGEKFSPSVQSLFPTVKISGEVPKQKSLPINDPGYISARRLFLAEFVLGLEGTSAGGVYSFFHKKMSDYITKYRDSLPSRVHHAIQAFQDLFYPIAGDVQRDKCGILNSLETNKRVLLAGGWDGKPGHTIFLDFTILPGLGNIPWVGLTLTNTGDGLEYHPQQNEQGRENFFRTIHLPPVALDQLRKSRFFEVMLPFLNERIKDPEFLKVPFSNPNLGFTAQELLQMLTQFWPSSQRDATVSNYGGDGRGRSCSLLSITKWLKETIGDDDDYARLKIFMKMQALEESLTPEQLETAEFIEDATAKISRQLQKMVAKKIARPEDLTRWDALKQAALAKAAELRHSSIGDERNLTHANFTPIAAERIAIHVSPLK